MCIRKWLLRKLGGNIWAWEYYARRVLICSTFKAQFPNNIRATGPVHYVDWVKFGQDRNTSVLAKRAPLEECMRLGIVY